MEFDQEESNMEIADLGEKAKNKEDEDYRIRKVRMTNLKKHQKTDIKDTEIKQIAEIKKSKKELEAVKMNLQEMLNDRIYKLIRDYEDNEKKLRA